MNKDIPLDHPALVDRDPLLESDREYKLPIHAETVDVSRRKIEHAVVRAALTTHSRDVAVDEKLNSERVEIERVPIGRIVDAMPPIREEGDTTIIPVVEEMVVVERRLVLKEEVRLRRVKSMERHVETVVVREQKVTVTRAKLDPMSGETKEIMANEPT